MINQELLDLLENKIRKSKIYLEETLFRINYINDNYLE